MNDTRFDTVTFELKPDYGGDVTATLVSLRESLHNRCAVLYIHGYGDYFFQEHLADFYAKQGLAFYALDLRKHGRSLSEHQRPNFAKSLDEYYEEIALAIEHIRKHHNYLLLNGHSTGALTASLFLQDHALANQVDALFLNSPFWEFSLPGFLKKWVLPRLAGAGKKTPYKTTFAKLSKLYGMSIHKDFNGEWSYNRTWKPVGGFPIYQGWMNAIYTGQQRIWKGLTLDLPILVMHSDRSVFRLFRWSDDLLRADAVLNVEDMRKHSYKLGNQVEQQEIPEAMHDIFLSSSQVRQHAFDRLAEWIGRTCPLKGESNS